MTLVLSASFAIAFAFDSCILNRLLNTVKPAQDILTPLVVVRLANNWSTARKRRAPIDTEPPPATVCTYRMLKR